MSHYLIRQIHKDPMTGEVIKASVCSVHRKEDGQPGDFGLGDDVLMSQAEIASLIAFGNDVRCALIDGPGMYKPGDKIRIRPHSKTEFLESINEAGQVTRQLLELPFWPNNPAVIPQSSFFSSYTTKRDGGIKYEYDATFYLSGTQLHWSARVRNENGLAGEPAGFVTDMPTARYHEQVKALVEEAIEFKAGVN